MMNIYQPPKSDLQTGNIGLTQKLLRGKFFLVLVLCFISVSYLSSFINELLVHLVVKRNSAFYWDVRLVSDLVQCSLYLGLGGYFLAKIFYRKWWVVGSIISIIFVINSIRIIGFSHIVYETCERHWYDLLILIKTPIAFYILGYFGYRSLEVQEND